MSIVDQIKDAIPNLSAEDLAAFRQWFAEYDAAHWDQQIARDAAAGLLDGLADEALADLREGHCTDL